MSTIENNKKTLKDFINFYPHEKDISCEYELFEDNFVETNTINENIIDTNENNSFTNLNFENTTNYNFINQDNQISDAKTYVEKIRFNIKSKLSSCFSLILDESLINFHNDSKNEDLIYNSIILSSKNKPFNEMEKFFFDNIINHLKINSKSKRFGAGILFKNDSNIEVEFRFKESKEIKRKKIYNIEGNKIKKSESSIEENVSDLKTTKYLFNFKVKEFYELLDFILTENQLINDSNNKDKNSTKMIKVGVKNLNLTLISSNDLRFKKDLKFKIINDELISLYFFQKDSIHYLNFLDVITLIKTYFDERYIYNNIQEKFIWCFKDDTDTEEVITETYCEFGDDNVNWDK